MILALQCCPLDSAQTIELARLIADIEPQQRKDHIFCVSMRRDTPVEHVSEAARLLGQKFETVWVVRGERRGEGWPEGPNDLWAETMMRVSIANKGAAKKQTGVLTFEADCIPLRADWIDTLAAFWDSAERRGLDCCGHAHGEPPDHINGNAIFRIGLLRRYPQLNSADRRKGWDHCHGELLLNRGEDIDGIVQEYALRDYDRAYIERVRKNGVVPALLHGTKGMGGIRIARELLRDGVLAANAKGARGGNRAFVYQRPQPTLDVPVSAPGEFSGSL